jgi:hypothetical protein
MTTEAPAAEIAGAAGPATSSRSADVRHAPSASCGAPRSTSEERPRGPRPVPVTVWRRMAVEPAEAFEIVVPVDLARVFRGYGPLPAVSGTDEPAGAERWGQEGQRRTVRLADGSSLEETVVEATRPGLFRYEVVPTSGALRLLVRRIDGRFVFSHSECGGTVVRWTYVFRPRHLARPFVRALAPLWRRYAMHVMEHLVAEVQAAAPPAAGASTPTD